MQLHATQVVVLANLFPPDPKQDELDSFMYQTVRMDGFLAF